MRVRVPAIGDCGIIVKSCGTSKEYFLFSLLMAQKDKVQGRIRIKIRENGPYNIIAHIDVFFQIFFLTKISRYFNFFTCFLLEAAVRQPSVKSCSCGVGRIREILLIAIYLQATTMIALCYRITFFRTSPHVCFYVFVKHGLLQQAIFVCLLLVTPKQNIVNFLLFFIEYYDSLQLEFIYLFFCFFGFTGFTQSKQPFRNVHQKQFLTRSLLGIFPMFYPVANVLELQNFMNAYSQEHLLMADADKNVCDKQLDLR